MHCHRQRPYHREYTGSRLITEVKHGWAWSVLAWVTCWEHRVSLAYLLSKPFYHYERHEQINRVTSLYIAVILEFPHFCPLKNDMDNVMQTSM